MATKCMSCGGSKMKMKEGGKVTTIKKMKVGGVNKNYDEEYPTLEDLEKKNRREFLKGKSAKVGIITAFTGVGAGLGKMIADAKKKRTAVKAGAKVLREADPEMTKRQSMQKSRNTINNPLSEEKRGGAVKKKYAMGGAADKANIPLITNNPRADQGRILKAGGSTTNRTVKRGCTGGMIKDASGKCVMERKFKAGGSTTNKKFAALAPPYNKATFADRIAGAKKKAGKK